MSSLRPTAGGTFANAESTPEPAPGLDIPHLSAQTFGDLALQHEILTLFIDQTAEILAALADPAARPSRHADLLHKLIGSARAIGAFELVAAAETADLALRAGHPPSRALQTLPAAADRALVAAREYLAIVPRHGD